MKKSAEKKLRIAIDTLRRIELSAVRGGSQTVSRNDEPPPPPPAWAQDWPD